MAASSQWICVNYSFKLYTTYHVFGHFGFDWRCPYIQSSKQCTIYIYIYMPIRATHEYLWNSPHFMRYKLAYPWWGSNPRSLDYIQSSITRHVSDRQGKATQTYFYIAGSPNIQIVYENDKKYELNLSDDGHYESYDLWENGVIDSLAYGRNRFSAKLS